MKLIYDARDNIAFLRFQEKTAQVETIHLVMSSTSTSFRMGPCSVSKC
jgi:hypothetical protein